MGLGLGPGWGWAGDRAGRVKFGVTRWVGGVQSGRKRLAVGRIGDKAVESWWRAVWLASEDVGSDAAQTLCRVHRVSEIRKFGPGSWVVCEVRVGQTWINTQGKRKKVLDVKRRDVKDWASINWVTSGCLFFFFG